MLALFVAPTCVLGEESVADIMNVAGTVMVAKGQDKTPAAPGGKLMQGDVVTTGRDGSVGLSFKDGSRVSLGAESDFLVEKYQFEPQDKSYSMMVLLRKGVAAVSTGKMGKLAPEAMKISTPLATLGIRGTKFLVNVK